MNAANDIISEQSNETDNKSSEVEQEQENKLEYDSSDISEQSVDKKWGRVKKLSVADAIKKEKQQVAN